MDGVLNRIYGWRWNPIHQSGTLAVWMLLVLLVTGLYLVLFYRIGDPSGSVGRIAADPWLGSWMRSAHRYATDVFVVAAVLHAIRIFGQGRSWGARTRAWVSGVALVGIGLACTWTGYVMAWDTFGQRLAVEGARLIDALPLLSEPVSRVFAGDAPIPGAFFFINLFAHIGLPLLMGVGLWLHVSKLARPVVMPPRTITWVSGLALLALSVVVPAPLGPAADPLLLPSSTPVDYITTWWLPLAERFPASFVWAVVLVMTSVAVAVPWMTRRPREGTRAPSVVDPRLCTGCNQCPQDCPWDAITMVERGDDRPSLVAQVDPVSCVSCGICAASCAPMGIGPPGLSGRSQMAALQNDFPVDLVRSLVSPSIVVAYCANTPVGAVSLLAASGAHLHPVSCVGNLHSSVVESLLRRGAGGVLIGACPPRDCQGREGPKWLDERLFNKREAELQDRVDRRRVMVATFAPGCEADAVRAFADLAERVGALERAVAETNVVVEDECVPVPIEEDAQ